MNGALDSNGSSLRTAVAQLALGLCIAVSPLAAIAADAQEPPDLAGRAAAALQASEWATAAELFGELVEARPEDGTAWYRLGVARMRAGGDSADSRAAFEKAVELGFPAAPALLGIARTHAIDESTEAVLTTMERLAEQGPSSFVVSQLDGDDAFTGIAADSRFQALVTRLTPCATEEYRQFDFWLGTWDVVSPQGQALGTNIVTESLDGCMLIENWESASGGQKGLSINYYDRVEGNWAQIFRDNSGNIAQWPKITGTIVDGSMVLESAADTQPRTRWVWTKQDDGRVRQMAESSSDSGETWAVVWDSYYVRVD